MLSLYDMLANAQNGRAFEQMAKQFGLSQAQVQEAVSALLPAFSQGLKRNTSSPADLGSFLSALSSGQHARYFEDAAAAFGPQGTQEGNGILGHLFGSKDLSRAVASQAAQATGLGQDLLKQMLPVLASMIMGGLFKQSTGQVGASPSRSNPLQEIIEQMMQKGGGTARPQVQPDALDNPFGKILEGMFGGGGQARPKPAQESSYGDNPLGRIFKEMMGGGQRAQPDPAPKPAPKTSPGGRARTPYDDLFGDMFEAGARTRDDYQKGMESVFDQFLQGMRNRRSESSLRWS